MIYGAKLTISYLLGTDIAGRRIAVFPGLIVGEPLRRSDDHVKSDESIRFRPGYAIRGRTASVKSSNDSWLSGAQRR